MTLKRLMILLAILIFLAGVGIAWFWQYAYSPEGRARVIIAQLKNDPTSLRGWMLQNHIVRPGYSVPPRPKQDDWEPNENDVYVRVPYSDPSEEMPEERREREITIAKEEIIKLGRGVLPVVIEALKDPAPDVRRMAIPICGTFRDPAAIDPLVKCMRAAAYNPHGISSGVVDFTHGLEQQYCLESLVEIGPGACGPLMEGSKGCEPEARACLPGMIAQNWGAAGVPQLIGLLEDSDGSVRAKAALNLGGFKDKRATDPLIGHLIDVDEVSHNAALALGEIADSKAIPALQRTLDNTHLGDSDRIPAAGALARMGRNDGLDYLLALLRALNPADVRMMVADALGTDRIKGTIDPLLSLLEDSDENVQITAVQNLGQLHDPRAIPALRKMKDENEGNAGLRYPIVQALKELGDKTPPASQPASKP